MSQFTSYRDTAISTLLLPNCIAIPIFLSPSSSSSNHPPLFPYLSSSHRSVHSVLQMHRNTTKLRNKKNEIYSHFPKYSTPLTSSLLFSGQNALVQVYAMLHTSTPLQKSEVTVINPETTLITTTIAPVSPPSNSQFKPTWLELCTVDTCFSCNLSLFSFRTFFPVPLPLPLSKAAIFYIDSLFPSFSRFRTELSTTAHCPRVMISSWHGVPRGAAVPHISYCIAWALFIPYLPCSLYMLCIPWLSALQFINLGRREVFHNVLKPGPWVGHKERPTRYT